MIAHLKALWRDERGSEYVDLTLITAGAAVFMGGYYSVLNNNALLRATSTKVIDRLAQDVGRDIAGAGAPVRGGPSIPQPRIRNPNLGGIVKSRVRWSAPERGLRTVFSPDKATYTIIDILTNDQLVIRPAAGVAAIGDPSGTLTFVDDRSLGTVVLDLLDGAAYLIDPITNLRTNIDLLSLQQLGVIDILPGQADVANVEIGAPVLGIATILHS